MSKGWVSGYDIYDDRGKDGGAPPSFSEKNERETPSVCLIENERRKLE